MNTGIIHYYAKVKFPMFPPLLHMFLLKEIQLARWQIQGSQLKSTWGYVQALSCEWLGESTLSIPPLSGPCGRPLGPSGHGCHEWSQSARSILLSHSQNGRIIFSFTFTAPVPSLLAWLIELMLHFTSLSLLKENLRERLLNAPRKSLLITLVLSDNKWNCTWEDNLQWLEINTHPPLHEWNKLLLLSLTLKRS